MTRWSSISHLMWLPCVLALVAAAAVVPSCSSDATGRRPGPLRVVATTSIVGDMVRAVGGDHIELSVLCGPNADPHTFSPSLSAGSVLLDADVVFGVGLGAEPWLDKLASSSGSRATVVELGDGFPDLIRIDGAEEDDEHDHGHEHEHDHAHEHEHAHDHGPVDPHVWHDVTAAIHMTAGIRDALIKAAPEKEADWQAAAAAAIGRLHELDTWVKTQVESIAPARRQLVTAHATHNYFARRYGFVVVADLIGSTSTASADPSLGHVARLVAVIKEKQVRAVFAENTSGQSGSVMDNVARDAGVPLHRLFTDALDAPDQAAGSYDGLIRTNVRTIVDALK